MIQAATIKQCLELMIVEAQNELIKCEVMKRLYNKQELRAESLGRLKDVQMANETKTRHLKKTLADLLDMHTEELKKETLASTGAIAGGAVPTTPLDTPPNASNIKP